MRKKKLQERFSVKVFVFLVTVIAFLIGAAGIAACFYLAEEGLYSESFEEFRQPYIAEAAAEEAWDILELLEREGKEAAGTYCANKNIVYELRNEYGKKLAGNDMEDITQKYHAYLIKPHGPSALSATYAEENVTKYLYMGEAIPYYDGEFTMTVYLDTEHLPSDRYQAVVRLTDGLHRNRWLLVWGTGISLVSGILCFIFLMCSAGRKYGQEKVMVKGFFKIPMDVLSLCLAAAYGFLFSTAGNISHYTDALMEYAVAYVLLGSAGLSLTVGYCMIFAMQAKAGILWKNTVIGRILYALYKVFRLIGKEFGILCRNITGILAAGLALAGLYLAEFLYLAVCGMDRHDVVTVWLAERIFLIPAVLYFALCIYKLLKKTESIADGNLSDKVNTGYFVGDLKAIGENLNSIEDGLNLAVEERMKSERLKTELITNVSHDIKTPLTSIINYAELIAKEETENEKISEYARVLTRQSGRLKKLMEDLMEASKAATGNVEVHLMPCEVAVLLTQTVGEYEQRLKEKELDLVIRQKENTDMIYADGKLLWRVFDNLMNNICKYAMRGTRVYLTVEEQEDKVRISFKNISAYPLEVSSQELMERFVRGDRSRHTEGNGLGLSIAQSLTVLQGGQMELTVDGDFFKAVLIFAKKNRDGQKEH